MGSGWRSGVPVVAAALACAGAASGRGLAASQGTPFAIPRQTLGVLDSALSRVEQVDAASGDSAALAEAQSEGLPVVGGQLEVIVVPRPSALADAETAVGSAGGAVSFDAGGLVQALVPPSSLKSLAESSQVAGVRRPAIGVTEAVDEGVVATNASALQAAGIDGMGVKVAIIDLGFRGYDQYLGSALPATVAHYSWCSGANGSTTADIGGTDPTPHGVAVAEIVHQMAPGAQLELMCVDSEAGLAAAEIQAEADRDEIINHSVSWYGTSRGDGTAGWPSPEGVVMRARRAGILWVNSAGNDGAVHWRGSFSPAASYPALNDFGGGSVTNDVVVDPGREACVVLKWEAWPWTTEDYDLGVFDQSGNLVASSTIDQAAEWTGGPGLPVEGTCWLNTGSGAANYGIVIERYDGVTFPRMDLYVLGASRLEFSTPSASIDDPASAPGALAVGAACWQSGSLEPYSSQGPTIDGRIKPDLVAPDGTSSSIYGNAGSTCGQGGFLGTSASAPQVAGAAALLLQQQSYLEADVLDAAVTLEPQLEEMALAHSGMTDPTSTTGYGGLWLSLPHATAATPQVIAAPTISGTTQDGSYLAATPGAWQTSPLTTFAYTWSSCDASGANCVPISGLQSITGKEDDFYRLTTDEVGHTIRVTVAATTPNGSTTSISAPTPVVEPAPPQLESEPAITVTSNPMGAIPESEPGATDSVYFNGAWTGSPTFTYQWRRCDAEGAACGDIPSATGTQYVQSDADVGHTIRLTVFASTGGPPVPASSIPIGPINPIPPAPVAPPPSGGSSGGGGGGGNASNADLTVDLAANQTQATPVGSEILLFATVKLATPANFSDTRLDITLPDGLTYEHSYIDRGTCSQTATGLDCDSAFISPGIETHLTIWALVAKPGEVDVTATVRSLLEPDFNPGNNSITLKLLPPSSDSGGSVGETTTAPALIRRPQASGRAVVGQTLRAIAPAWTDKPTKLSYQWYLCRGKRCTSIRGATHPTLNIGAGYVGHAVEFTVTASFRTTTLRATSRPIAIAKTR